MPLLHVVGSERYRGAVPESGVIPLATSALLPTTSAIPLASGRQIIIILRPLEEKGEERVVKNEKAAIMM